MPRLLYLGAASVMATVLELACATTGWANANADEMHSQRIVTEFFDRPEKYSRIEIRQTQSGSEVEICGDDCDLFRLKVGGAAKDHHLWDAIVLFKVFVSPALADEPFVAKQMGYADMLLGKYSTGKCSDVQDRRGRALCALGALSRKLGLKYSYARYDEGYRCQSVWINPDQVDHINSVKVRCTKAIN